MSAKLKLTMWVSLQMILLSAFIIVFFCVVYGEAITDDPQGRLQKVVEKNANKLKYEDGAFKWKRLNYYKHGVYTVCYDEEGNILHGAEVEGIDPSYPLKNRVLRELVIDDTLFLVYDIYVDMGITGVWLRGVIDSDNHSGVMNTFVVLVSVLVPSMLIISIGGGWFIAWRSFKPLDKIIDTADSINEGTDLTGRIGLKKGPKEMKRLSKTFDNMFDRLFKSFNSERQFASDASHELRTPVTVILAECDRANRKNKTVEEYQASIDVIRNQGLHMSDLINQLLVLTRIEQGTDKYPLSENNISLMIESYCEEFVPSDSRGISFTSNIEADLYAACNLTLIASVAQNLLTNAYKYGKENGTILLRLYSDSKYIFLSVKDDGQGIAKEDQEHIFKRFWQADSSRGLNTGAGLGLSMVNEIAELHKGSISVVSELGQGSEFIFSLPKLDRK